MSLRRCPHNAIPPLPADAAGGALGFDAMRASRDCFLVWFGVRRAESTRAAIVTVARAIATGAWS